MDMQKRYSSDLSDKQWRYLRPHIPEALPGGRHRSHDMRSVVNAILYRVKNGCIWQDLPHDFPPHQTVYEYYRASQFIQDGGSKVAASELFEVGESTIYLWMKTPDRTKALKTGPKGNWKPDLSKLSTVVQEKPDAYLSELAESLGTGVSTVFYGLKKLKLSRKKNQPVRGTKRRRA